MPKPPSGARASAGQSQAALTHKSCVRASLEAGDVHVWWTRLAVHSGVVSAYEALLASDERRRAKTFRFPDDRRRFVVGRAVLRLLLARTIGCDARAVCLAVNGFGKPSLAMPHAIHFNVSHSHELAAYAIARQPIGIDIEWEQPVPEALEIARRRFSREEIVVLERLPPEDRSRAFLACWTRQEACLKAAGVGLSLGVTGNELDETSSAWHQQAITLASGYVGALASSERADEPRVRQWLHDG
jgi:4'-phosphopantetheinyl transferase